MLVPWLQTDKIYRSNITAKKVQFMKSNTIFVISDSKNAKCIKNFSKTQQKIFRNFFGKLYQGFPPWPTRKFLCQIFELFLQCLVHFNMGITNTIFILHRFWPELNNWGKTILAGNSKARSKFWPFFLKWRNFFGNFYYYRPCL